MILPPTKITTKKAQIIPSPFPFEKKKKKKSFTFQNFLCTHVQRKWKKQNYDNKKKKNDNKDHP